MSNTPENKDQATIRRAPKLAMFLVVGGGLGAVVTFILTALYPVDKTVGFGALFGYFLLYGVPAGVVLGAIVGLILDRRSRRRQTIVTIEHESVVEAEPVDTGPVTDESVVDGPIELEAQPLDQPTDPDATGPGSAER